MSEPRPRATVRTGLLPLACVFVLMIAAISCSGSDGGHGRNPVAKSALAVRDRPSGEAAARNRDGIDHLAWGHWRKAAADFKRAIDADPSVAEPHYNLALALSELGDNREAGNQFRAALAISPADDRIANSPLAKRFSK